MNEMPIGPEPSMMSNNNSGVQKPDVRVCSDCGERDPCDEDCPNHPGPGWNYVAAPAQETPEIVTWLRHEADIMTNSLHCGDNAITIQTTHNRAAELLAVANYIQERAPRRSPAATEQLLLRAEEEIVELRKQLEERAALVELLTTDVKKWTDAYELSAASVESAAECDALADEGIGVLINLSENILRRGHYSIQSTVTFLDNAASCFRQIKRKLPSTVLQNDHEPRCNCGHLFEICPQPDCTNITELQLPSTELPR